jgi:hypothetical protein
MQEMEGLAGWRTKGNRAVATAGATREKQERDSAPALTKRQPPAARNGPAASSRPAYQDINTILSEYKTTGNRGRDFAFTVLRGS